MLCVHLSSYSHVGCFAMVFSRFEVLVVWCANISCVRKNRAINAKCLKISAKTFANSDFLRIFARFLCALRPRVCVRLGPKGVGRVAVEDDVWMRWERVE